MILQSLRMVLHRGSGSLLPVNSGMAALLLRAVEHCGD